MYIDRDDQNNIVSIYARCQFEGQERIEEAELTAQLSDQDFEWDHDY